VEYRHALPEDFADRSATFDVVMALEVVEHVGDLSAFLEALARLAAPGGIVVIATLNRTIRSFVKAIVGAEYILRWLPPGTHDWRKFVTPQELDLGLRHHGFEVMERCRVTYNLMTRRWTISADDGITYMQFHRKSH
jgi:2-polyprenyl-6-hydroxyphenyl methylase/3-demethylubiquinone-9 3-methyltransferase